MKSETAEDMASVYCEPITEVLVQSPQRGPGTKPLVGEESEGEAPKAEHFLACRHPKEGQICQILDISDKKRISG